MACGLGRRDRSRREKAVSYHRNPRSLLAAGSEQEQEQVKEKDLGDDLFRIRKRRFASEALYGIVFTDETGALDM